MIMLVCILNIKGFKGGKIMFKIKIYCNDINVQYWDDGIGTYETYDKALIACYQNALQEASNLMSDADKNRWFEVEENFEVIYNKKTKHLYAKSFVQVFRFLINLYKGRRWAIRTSIFVSECLGKRLFALMANDGRLKDNSSFPFVNFQRNIRRPAVFFPECLWYRDLSPLVDSYLIHRNFLPQIKKVRSRSQRTEKRKPRLLRNKP